MMLNVSLDGGGTWSEYAPALLDFDRYPATLLRFVDGDDQKEERAPTDGPESV